jgi:RNA polymerase sigma factor (sigma-70 family)
VTEDAPVIHVVDDDPSFRTAISRLLRAAGYEVRVYGSAGDFLLEPSSNGSGCVLLDVRMPGPSGLELHEAMARRGDTLPVIFLTGHGDIPQSVRAMRQGAADFLTKPIRRSELIPVIRQALARQEAEAESSGRRKEVAERFAKLTPREKEVFELVVAGRLNKQIAALLGTSERTVKAHRARIMEKMQVDSVAGLVHADGWLRPRSRS